jgi:hypothetical protein
MQNLLHTTHLHKPPTSHHRHPRSHLRHHRQAVRYKNVSKPKLPLQVLQQQQNLRPDRHIQSRHGLVRYHQPRPQNQRPSNPDPLPLPTGKLMRILFHRVFGQPDAQQHRDCAIAPFRTRKSRLVNRQGFRDNSPHPHPGIQRRKRILKDHLHLTPLYPQGFAAQPQQILAVKSDFAGVRLDQPQQHPRECGLAATALPDNRERLAGHHREADAIHRRETWCSPVARQKLRGAPITLPQFPRFQKTRLVQGVLARSSTYPAPHAISSHGRVAAIATNLRIVVRFSINMSDFRSIVRFSLDSPSDVLFHRPQFVK